MAKWWGPSDAYKQVPLSDEAFHLDSYLAVYDPENSSAKIFKQCVPARTLNILPRRRLAKGKV